MTNSKSLWDFHRQQTSSCNCHSVAGAFSVMASPDESADPSTGQPLPQKAEDIIYYRGTRPTKKAPADWTNSHRQALFYLCTSKRRRRGPGGDRTLVQTGKSYAFYTLISAIVFEQRWVQSNSYVTLSSKFSPRLRGQSQLFPICLHHYARELRKKSFGVMSRPLTPWTDKALMYYTSIKQREHNCFRQLNCWRPILKCPPSGALRAYAPPRPAVKSGRARNVRCKGRHWARGSQLLLVLFYFDLLPVISLFQPKMRPQ